MHISFRNSKVEDITFNCGGFEMLRLCSNGDIFVKGNISSNDIKCVDALKEFIENATRELATIERHETILEGKAKL